MLGDCRQMNFELELDDFMGYRIPRTVNFYRTAPKHGRLKLGNSEDFVFDKALKFGLCCIGKKYFTLKAEQLGAIKYIQRTQQQRTPRTQEISGQQHSHLVWARFTQLCSRTDGSPTCSQMAIWTRTFRKPSSMGSLGVLNIKPNWQQPFKKLVGSTGPSQSVG